MLYAPNFPQISALESFTDLFPRCSVKLLFHSVTVETVETVETVYTVETVEAVETVETVETAEDTEEKFLIIEEF